MTSCWLASRTISNPFNNLLRDLIESRKKNEKRIGSTKPFFERRAIL
jgi:hypothetical protein